MGKEVNRFFKLVEEGRVNLALDETALVPRRFEERVFRWELMTAGTRNLAREELSFGEDCGRG